MPTIKKDDVTAKRICQVLNAAAIESSLDDDGDIYAKKGGIDFGLWVKFPADKRLSNFLPTLNVKKTLL